MVLLEKNSLPTATNMGLPQAGPDKLTSAFYRYCALTMGLDRFIIVFTF